MVKSMLRAEGTSLQTLSRTKCTAQWDMIPRLADEDLGGFGAGAEDVDAGGE